VVVNVFLTSKIVALNHFAEGSQIQTYDFAREPHWKILTQVNWHVLFHCRTKSVTQDVRGWFKNSWEPYKKCLGAARSS